MHVYIIVFILSCFIYWTSAGLVQVHTHIVFFTFKPNCDVSEKMESSDKQLSKNKDYILNVHIKIESRVM